MAIDRRPIYNNLLKGLENMPLIITRPNPNAKDTYSQLGIHLPTHEGKEGVVSPGKLVDICAWKYRKEAASCDTNRFEDLFGNCKNVCLDNSINNHTRCLNELLPIPNNFMDHCGQTKDRVIVGMALLLTAVCLMPMAKKVVKHFRPSFPKYESLKLLPAHIPRPSDDTACAVSLESYKDMTDPKNKLEPVRIARFKDDATVNFSEHVFTYASLQESQVSFYGDDFIDPTNRQPFNPRTDLYREPLQIEKKDGETITENAYKDLELGEQFKKSK